MKRITAIIILTLSIIAAVTATEIHEIKSRYIPSPAKITVALPAGYNPAEAHRWPVTYLLNGHGGDHTTWGKLVNLDSLATANSMIIVCPAGLDSWYWDAPADPSMKMESYIIRELIPWVDSHYTTRTDRSGRAISGLPSAIRTSSARPAPPAEALTSAPSRANGTSPTASAQKTVIPNAGKPTP